MNNMDVLVFQLLTALLLGVIIGIILILLLTKKEKVKAEGRESVGGQDIISLLDEVRKLPVRVLHTLQGSISPRKGKVGELIFYTRLLSEYDRLIPLGQPIDFIGIKNRRTIDLIEVKTGGSGLTKEEAEIKRLVEEGRVRFVLQRIDQEVYHQRKLDDI
ncbi:MAG: hypothetical protein KAU14_01010 [Thermoplasmata archaeon]|nr:hypothetical protein [Thermoplasmata archaeon]